MAPEYPQTGDKGWKLGDVADGKVALSDFVAQLSDEDLVCMVRGEGMCSPKVTPGTAGAFGGVTQRLVDFGIPTGCCADGPSGIRMDCGTRAFARPAPSIPSWWASCMSMQGLSCAKTRWTLCWALASTFTATP